MKVAVIGVGNMGGAFARGFIEKGLVSKANLLLVEKNKVRHAEIKQDFGAEIFASIPEHLSEVDFVVLAVKPQDMATTCSEFLEYLNPDSVVLSVMAGVTCSAISNALQGHLKVVRCMPNMPAAVGRGMCVYFAGTSLSPSEIQQVAQLLETTGACLQLGSEQQIDAATAVSGSGPGFFFYIVDHMFKECEALGFSPDQAKLLLGQTIEGSIALWRDSEESAKTLQGRVTSKGGTTAAGLNVFEDRAIGEALRAGMRAAFDRAGELAKLAK